MDYDQRRQLSLHTSSYQPSLETVSRARLRVQRKYHASIDTTASIDQDSTLDTSIV